MKTKSTELKTMKCKTCKNIVTNVGEHAKSTTCSDCIQKQIMKAQSQQENELKGGLKMSNETTQVAAPIKELKQKKEKFGATKYVKCSKCKKEKFARSEVYDARVKKFGSEEAMLKGFICRDCKSAAKA